MVSAEIDARLVVIGAAGEGIEAEGTERQRHDKGIARPALQVRQRRRQRIGASAFDHECERRDMALLACGAASCHDRLRARDRLQRRIALLVDGMKPGAGRMRQREVRIARQRALQRLRCAGPEREQAIDAVAIGLRRVRRVCRERQSVAVLLHGATPRAACGPRSDRPDRCSPASRHGR